MQGRVDDAPLGSSLAKRRSPCLFVVRVAPIPATIVPVSRSGAAMKGRVQFALRRIRAAGVAAQCWQEDQTQRELLCYLQCTIIISDAESAAWNRNLCRAALKQEMLHAVQQKAHASRNASLSAMPEDETLHMLKKHQ
eukprot:1250264-Rhodomonas_salina.1